jgi:hypothetical protein
LIGGFLIKITLTYIGNDSYDNRPVYKNENGKLFVDVDPRKDHEPKICTKYQFDGEPDTPINCITAYSNAEIEFIPKRITW